ncbi:hypothetical protein PTKIN_Ptkin10aG0200800 [Pterospermum kingtungense]
MESPFKADILKGKVALVTGGGSGIGYEFHCSLGNMAPLLPSGDDANLCLTLPLLLFIPLASLYAIGLEGDVRKDDDAARIVESTFNHFGGLDILVNAAAGNFLVPAEDLSSNGFRTVIDIDSVGTFRMCHHALKYLKKGGPGKDPSTGGTIINISAILHFGATWYQIHASAGVESNNYIFIQNK